MHYKLYKNVLSPKNGMNLYRGCTHGCIYCDSRSLCYQMDHHFEDIEVKEHAPQLLEDALKRKRNKGMISTGAMGDPYVPIEEKLKYTRKSLEIIHKYGYGLAIHTKSALILRDLDLLEAIHKKAKCVVQLTMTTFDEDLSKVIEPNVATTRERFNVLIELKQRNIPTVIWLTPILPFINDTEENIQGILAYGAESGVKGIMTFGIGLTLRAGNREYFYHQLDRHFPGLNEKYKRIYGNSYEIHSPHKLELMSLITEFCVKHSILSNQHEIFSYLSRFEIPEKDCQLRMF